MPARKKKQPDEVVAEQEDGVVRILPGTEPPASSPDSREGQLINLAVNLAEKQLREGTASSQVIVHYLKLATKREHLEREIMQKQARLIEAKVDSIDTAKQTESVYREAIEAMKRYSGNS